MTAPGAARPIGRALELPAAGPISEVLAIHNAFYDALGKGDETAMAAVWEPAQRAVAGGPGPAAEAAGGGAQRAAAAPGGPGRATGWRFGPGPAVAAPGVPGPAAAGGGSGPEASESPLAAEGEIDRFMRRGAVLDGWGTVLRPDRRPEGLSLSDVDVTMERGSATVTVLETVANGATLLVRRCRFNRLNPC